MKNLPLNVMAEICCTLKEYSFCYNVKKDVRIIFCSKGASKRTGNKRVRVNFFNVE